jgi:multicomponent Na+:H+ antiporter subunit E
MLWLFLSGRFEPGFLALGLISSVTIAWLHGRQPGSPAPTIPFFRFMVYLPWLFFRITWSNFHMVRVILHPRLPIRPKLIRYRTHLRNPAAVTLLANSITLTPGTVTVEVQPADLVVHVLDETFASDLASDRLEKKVAWVFPQKGI